MDRRTQKLIAAERLRRQNARDREAEEIRAAAAEHYDLGRRRGHREARVEPVKLPYGFIEQVLRDMSAEFARLAMSRLAGDLPFPVVGTVAERVWKEMNWGAVDMRRCAELFVQHEFDGDVSFNLYVPEMHCGHRVDRRLIELAGGK